MKDLPELVGISYLSETSRTSFYVAREMTMRRGFPKPVGKNGATILWLKSKVDEWISVTIPKPQPKTGLMMRPITASRYSLVSLDTIPERLHGIEIERSDLPKRVRDRLDAAGFKTFGDIKGASWSGLLRIRNFGYKSCVDLAIYLNGSDLIMSER